MSPKKLTKPCIIVRCIVFAKLWPIFEILSLVDLEENLLQNCHKTHILIVLSLLTEVNLLQISFMLISIWVVNFL